MHPQVQMQNKFEYISFHLSLAGRTWSQAALNKAQITYLSSELLRINEQRTQLRNNELSSKQAEERAKRLINIEGDRVKREAEYHAKKMKLLDIQISYWERKTNEDFPSTEQ